MYVHITLVFEDGGLSFNETLQELDSSGVLQTHMQKRQALCHMTVT